MVNYASSIPLLVGNAHPTWLQGPQSPGFSGPEGISRAAHFAGGRMKAVVAGVGRPYTIEMWIYSGMPGDARAVAGRNQ
jgi:hypothetical protein